jgi:nicotinamide-nucleotide amidase
MYDLDIITAIKNRLVAEHYTLAVAESVTSGHLQAAFSLADEASQFFQGGITAYNLEQKARLLKIDKIHAATCNCVSEKVAAEMAIALCNVFSCDWAIAVTGYASEDIQNDKGFLYAIYAIAFRGSPLEVNILKAHYRDVLQNQIFYANAIIREFKKVLGEK